MKGRRSCTHALLLSGVQGGWLTAAMRRMTARALIQIPRDSRPRQLPTSSGSLNSPPQIRSLPLPPAPLLLMLLLLLLSLPLPPRLLQVASQLFNF